MSRLRFLSTPSARRATLHDLHRIRQRHISIHALREEGDAPFFQLVGIEFEFLSTPSARRATWCCAIQLCYKRISIHALREEGDQLFGVGCGLLWNFYPRPPRGGRQISLSIASGISTFLSTPSARRATKYLVETTAGLEISIHALREEGDAVGCLADPFPAEFLSTPSARRATRRISPKSVASTYFYPRPPRGGRPICTYRQ